MTQLNTIDKKIDSNELTYLKFDLKVKDLCKNIAMMFILVILTSSYLVVSLQQFEEKSKGNGSY